MPIDDSVRFYLTFGKLLRIHRQKLGWTQEDLANRVKLSRTSITNIEAGRQQVLLHYLYVFAAALGTAPESLLPRSVSTEGANWLEPMLPKDTEEPLAEWAKSLVSD